MFNWADKKTNKLIYKSKLHPQTLLEASSWQLEAFLPYLCRHGEIAGTN